MKNVPILVPYPRISFGAVSFDPSMALGTTRTGAARNEKVKCLHASGTL